MWFVTKSTRLEEMNSHSSSNLMIGLYPNGLFTFGLSPFRQQSTLDHLDHDDSLDHDDHIDHDDHLDHYDHLKVRR